MNDQPLVSIVIPSYNHERYLRAAVESVLAQDYPHVELIVIEDGSTDGSRDILAGYTGRFHWESQPNIGQVATLNRAWAMSRGEIVAYLSADDLLYHAAAGSAVRCLMDNPDAILAYCDFDLIDPDSAVVRRVTTPEVSYDTMVAKVICPPGPGAFFRRRAFEQAGYWDPTFRQMLDYEYWLRLGLHGRFVRIPEVLAAYRVHAGSQSFAASTEIRPEEPVRIIECYFENAAVPPKVRERRDEARSNAHLISAQIYFRMGKLRPGLAALRRAFSLKPANLLSLDALRRLFNAAFNRIGHRTLWTARRALRAAHDVVGRGRGQPKP